MSVSSEKVEGGLSTQKGGDPFSVIGLKLSIDLVMTLRTVCWKNVFEV